MRVLVVDDYYDAEAAVANALQGTAHVVLGVRDPRSLPQMLAEEDPFDLAMVDMLFRGCPMSGLGAMRILRDSSPGTKVIVRSADEENRLLHLLAAFSFFEPLAFESKSEGPERIRDLVLAAQECKAVTSSASLYRLEGGLPDPVNRLIRNKTDLTLWQMLARFDKRD